MRRTGFPGLVLILCLLHNLPIFSQVRDSKILQFHGGNFSAYVTLSGSTLFTGIFRLDESPFDPWENPAFLGQVDQMTLMSYLSPPFSISIKSLYDLDAKIRSSVDNGIANYRDENLEVVYPTGQLRFRKGGNLAEGLFILPLQGMVFALGYQRPFSLSSRMIWSGFESTILTKVPVGETKSDVVFNNFFDAALNLGASFTATSLAISKPIENKYAIGFLIRRYSALVECQGFLDAQGIMLYNGVEYIFNNPNDLWYNDLTQSINGRYEGEGWETRWGSVYSLGSDMYLDLALTFSAPIKLEGQLDIRQNKIPALNFKALSGDEEAEILEPSKLELSQLTRTEPVENKTYPSLFIHLPDHLGVGFLLNRHPWKFYFNYGHFLEKFFIEYGDYRLGLQMGHSLKFSIGYGRFLARGQLWTARTFTEGSPRLKAAGSFLVIPKLNFHYGLTLARSYNFNFMLQVMPAPALGMTVGYRF